VPSYAITSDIEGPLLPLFTGDSKHLITARQQQLPNPERKNEIKLGPHAIFVDKKPVLEAPYIEKRVPYAFGAQTRERVERSYARLEEISVAPAGTNFVAVFKMPDDSLRIFFNEKAVSDVHRVDYIAWSPNGQRYAIRCTKDHGSAFMIVDGKQKADYRSIYVLAPENGKFCYDVWGRCRAFTSDSAKSVYMGSTDKQFLVVEDQEFGPYTNVDKVALSEEGSHVSFVGTNEKGEKINVVDGKAQP
jgi:hypothetical protein